MTGRSTDNENNHILQHGNMNFSTVKYLAILFKLMHPSPCSCGECCTSLCKLALYQYWIFVLILHQLDGVPQIVRYLNKSDKN